MVYLFGDDGGIEDDVLMAGTLFEKMIFVRNIRRLSEMGPDLSGARFGF